MDESETGSELQQKANKSRTPHKAGLVRAVLLQDVTDEEKIQRIVLIDLLPDPPPEITKGRGAILRSSKSSEPVPETADKALPRPTPQDTKSAVELARRSLSTPRSRGHWWTYLTRELTPLRRFGFDTGVLVANWVPFTFKLSEEADHWVRTQISERIARTLEPHLPAVVGKGWSTLSKREYNLVMAFVDVLRWWKGVNLPPAGSALSFWAQALLPGLPRVLLFSAEPALIDQTIQAWGRAVDATVPSRQRLPEGPQTMESLLRPTGLRLSLPDILQAILSVRQKRFTPWTEALSNHPGPYVWEDGFDASPEVREAIDQAVDQEQKHAEALEKQLWEARRLEFFVPGNHVLDSLDQGESRENREAWAQTFQSWVRLSAAPLLAGTFTIADGRTIALPEDPTIVSLIQRFAEFDMPVEEGTAPPSPLDLARVAMTLGKTLAVTIRKRTRLTEAWIHDWDKPTGDPLPGEDLVVDQPAFWAGETVGQSLVKAAQIAFAAARLLGDPSLDPALEQKGPAVTRSKDLLRTLERLATQPIFEGWKLRLEQASGEAG